MKQVYVRTVAGNERFVPANLRDFLISLEATSNSDDVWELLVAFADGIGLNMVEYVCATDFRDWEQAQFIRTTVDSSWIGHAQSDPDVRRLSMFRLHSVNFLTPVTMGMAYIDEIENVCPKRRYLIECNAKFGLNAGFAIPLRMNEPGQAAHIIFGGDFTRAEFDAILDQHGWAMHAVALSAHTRYIELFKAEFCERNELTEKQTELVRLVGRGLLDKQIAHDLGISFSAVRQRLAAVQQKTGCTNRAELAALAVRIGLVPDPMLKPHAADLTVFLSMADGASGTETVHHRAAAE